MNEAFWETVLTETNGEVKLQLQKPLTLQVGTASIVLKPNGEILLSGVTIKIKGGAEVELDSSGVMTVKGAIIKLN